MLIPFDGDTEKSAFVSSTCLVGFDRNRYSVESLRNARNVVFVGGTGTGKTHLATALAREVVLKGMRARCYSVVDLVNQLGAEKREGRAGRLANRLFHLISKLYERVSLIVTTNLSFGESSRV